MKKETTKGKKGRLAQVWEFLWPILVALVIITIIQFTRVDGPSMENTLHDHQLTLVTKLDYLFTSPQRGQIIICKYPNRGFREYFVKRIVGLAGDTIEVRDGVLIVNGTAQADDYVEYPAQRDYGPTTVPEGHIFVMGDNRAVSHDSRANDVGPLEESAIVGRVRAVIWPLSDFGSVQ